MPFAYFRVEKRGSLRQTVWTPRIIAIDVRRGHVYYSEEVISADKVVAPANCAWKRKFKLDSITLAADKNAFNVTDPHFDPRDLYTISLDGFMRHITPQDTGRDGPKIASAMKSTRDTASFGPLSRSNVLSPMEEIRCKSRILCTVRCDDYEDFMSLFSVARNVLVMSGHLPPVHFGLPPQDPRNGLAFPLVPLHLRCSMRILQNAVFYELLYGQLVFMSSSQLGRPLALKGYLCVTPDTIVVLRPDATVPRWIALDRISAVHYQANVSNSAETRGPFVAILVREEGADILFEPLPPLFPPSVRSAFRASTAVSRLRHVFETLLVSAPAAVDTTKAKTTSPVAVDASCAKKNAHAGSPRKKGEKPCEIVEHSDCPHVLAFIERGESIASRPLHWTADSEALGKLCSFTHKENLAAALNCERIDERKVRQVGSLDASAPMRVVVPHARDTNSPSRHTFLDTWSASDETNSRAFIHSVAADSAIVLSDEQLQTEEDEAFAVEASLDMLVELSARNGSNLSNGGSGSVQNEAEADSLLGSSLSSAELLSSSMF